MRVTYNTINFVKYVLKLKTQPSAIQIFEGEEEEILILKDDGCVIFGSGNASSTDDEG